MRCVVVVVDQAVAREWEAADPFIIPMLRCPQEVATNWPPKFRGHDLHSSVSSEPGDTDPSLLPFE